MPVLPQPCTCLQGRESPFTELHMAAPGGLGFLRHRRRSWLGKDGRLLNWTGGELARKDGRLLNSDGGSGRVGGRGVWPHEPRLMRRNRRGPGINHHRRSLEEHPVAREIRSRAVLAAHEASRQRCRPRSGPRRPRCRPARRVSLSSIDHILVVKAMGVFHVAGGG